jgi:hypothetical protein
MPQLVSLKSSKQMGYRQILGNKGDAGRVVACDLILVSFYVYSSILSDWVELIGQVLFGLDSVG